MEGMPHLGFVIRCVTRLTCYNSDVSL